MPGLAALAVLLGTIAAAFVGLLLAAGPNPPELPWAYVGSVVRFTLLQAALSTLLSILLGAAVALALARRSRFPGRSLFIAALNLASVLPAIVAVFGIVAVLGRAGWVGQAARPLGIDLGGWLYGLPGILIAHVFFNAPLAARVFLASLAAVPGEHWRLAAQLGMRPAAIFRLIDLPLLKREAPSVAALIFLLCFTSFAVVLALGGGPSAATLEVAIYESVRFDVDFARAGAACARCRWRSALRSRCRSSGLRGGPAKALPSAWRSSGPMPDFRPCCCRRACARRRRAACAAAACGGGARRDSPPCRACSRADVAAAAATSLAIAVPAALLAVALALGARGLRARRCDVGGAALRGRAMHAAAG